MNDINPVKPVIATPVLTPGLVTMLWVFLGVALLTATFLVFRYYWKRRPVKAPADDETETLEPETIVDYHALAIAGLEEAKRLLERGEYKAFHLRASEAVRTYLSYASRADFIDLTTREILKHDRLPVGISPKLEKFFNMSDPAKFAGRAAEEKIAAEAYELAKKIVE